MKNTPTIAELLKDHTTLTIESLDRVYLNGYVASLPTAGGLCHFLAERRDSPIPSPAVLGRMPREYVKAVEAFIEAEGIEMVRFERKDRKDDIANRIRAKCPERDVVVFVGTAQEKQTAFKSRTERGQGRVNFNYSRQSVWVKQYYFYLDDEDFGDDEIIEVVGEALGLSEDAIWDALDEGKTFAELAMEQGVEAQTLIDALMAEEEELIAELLAEGEIDEAEAEEWRAGSVEWIHEMVNEPWF